MKAKHIISISGGKDSLATRLIAIEKGIEHIAVFADTGNEHQITYDYLDYLEEKTGTIVRVKADFSKMIERKMDIVKNKWPGKGISQEKINEALSVLHPTGIPFLDLCLVKGCFPSNFRRFCSQYLKREAIDNNIVIPLLDGKTRIYSWQGVRADESRRRSKLTQIERLAKDFIIVRPILGWSAENVLKFANRHKIKHNPLYSMGFSRVGCMPCVNVNKNELRNISFRFPEIIEKIRKWEEIVSNASPLSWSSFLYRGKIKTKGNVGIDDFVRWSGTVHGGRQQGIIENLPPAECSSVYGLCE